jgi:hypothetical protein
MRDELPCALYLVCIIDSVTRCIVSSELDLQIICVWDTANPGIVIVESFHVMLFNWYYIIIIVIVSARHNSGQEIW